ncbi:hypothetical protein [Paenibacillus sp. 1P07SE]|uniref:hypothetical protein n=1 Tax=Paenibacillus sp. 1P07SE TaxID=3132209 RepID=UPI0039A5BC29
MESYRSKATGDDRRMTASGELGHRPAMAGSTVLPSGVTDLVRQLQSRKRHGASSRSGSGTGIWKRRRSFVR